MSRIFITWVIAGMSPDGCNVKTNNSIVAITFHQPITSTDDTKALIERTQIRTKNIQIENLSYQLKSKAINHHFHRLISLNCFTNTEQTLQGYHSFQQRHLPKFHPGVAMVIQQKGTQN